MKKLVIAGMLILAASCAFAENSQGQRSGPPSGDQHRQQMPGKFEDVKSNITRMLTERRSEIDKELSCVTAATNHESLRACRELRKNFRKEHHPQKWNQPQK